MPIATGPGEPAAGPWRAEPIAALVRTLLAGAAPGRPRIVAVDGRSASGKTTLADRLRAAVPGAGVVHTDDVAWWHSFVGWDELMRTGILEPLHRGAAVDYRPPPWDDRDRAGSITVAAGCPAVFLEGVGVGRRALAPWLDAVLWVQSDQVLARERGLRRDGGDEAVPFWDQWQAEEEPFLAADRPWERALAVVAGNAVTLPHDPAAEVVLAPPAR